ncbi:hypothetical protein L208DRAFT_1558599 [Tricholoma matsutake]|nr:hypothetical protein L208DRAFT_1558599 [Tricholoma matsutake 945]
MLNLVNYLVHLTCSLMDRFRACKPQIFWIDDIVQAQLLFIVIPVKGGFCKMLAMLRSLALLDGSFSKVCAQSYKTV